MVLQAMPQDPWNPGADKGPATFDVAQAFSTSVIQVLPVGRVDFLRPLGKKVLEGWQILNITTLTSGSPFSVYSGIQQTGVGSAGADRADQGGGADFFNRRKVREDYFGQGANNASYFSIPINIPGGTGPNQGRFGTLGRNTFRGPGYCDQIGKIISARVRTTPPTFPSPSTFLEARGPTKADLEPWVETPSAVRVTAISTDRKSTRL